MVTKGITGISQGHQKWVYVRTLHGDKRDYRDKSGSSEVGICAHRNMGRG